MAAFVFMAWQNPQHIPSATCRVSTSYRTGYYIVLAQFGSIGSIGYSRLEAGIVDIFFKAAKVG